MWYLCLCFAHFYLARGIITKENVILWFCDLEKQFQPKMSHLKRFDNDFKIMKTQKHFFLLRCWTCFQHEHLYNTVPTLLLNYFYGFGHTPESRHLWGT